ncbi:MAG: DmsC/YnfH family molybdoenzyme membrane anchor subunit [Pseudomonadota bacterium]
MHPAPSIILFTTISGLGFGVLAFLGLGMPALTGWAAFFAYGGGFALALIGLAASTFHLGRPERALRAFTQWRSSWLSREAWAAVLALAVMGLYAIGPVFLGARFALLGTLGALLCVLTVIATGMIYAQIRAIPRWHQPGTPALFVALSLTGGALLTGQALAGAAGLLATGALQLWVWQVGDGALARSGSSTGTATGLADRGRTRAFEAPHSGPNYLLREMVYQVGRKRADALRRVTLAAGIVAPLALLALGGGALWSAWAAAAVHGAGALAGRWLFFAEAEHVVGLYYGTPGGRTESLLSAPHG